MDAVNLSVSDLKLFSLKKNDNSSKVGITKKSKVLLNTCKTIEVLEVSEILRIEAYQNYTKVFIENDTMLLSSDSLTTLQRVLGSSFYICHKSHLVNLNKVSRYYKEGQVELIDGKKIPVARRRKTKFIEILHDWIETNI